MARDNGSWLEFYALNAATWGPLYTLNDVAGSYSISGKLTIGLEGKDPEDVEISSNLQDDNGGVVIITSSYGGVSLGDALGYLRFAISDALYTKGIPGTSFNLVSLDVTISKNN